MRRVSQAEQPSHQLQIQPVPLASITGKALDEYFDLFQTIDDDGSGDVTTVELAAMFQTMQIKVSDADLRAIIEAMDNDNSGTVSFAGERMFRPKYGFHLMIELFAIARIDAL